MSFPPCPIQSLVTLYNVQQMPGVTSYSSQSQGLSVLIVFSLSAIQYLSGLCLYMIDGYKKMRNTIRLVNISPNPVGNDQRDYASCMVLAIAEVASMRERSASSAILLLMQFIASAFCNFLDKCVQTLPPQCQGLSRKI